MNSNKFQIYSRKNIHFIDLLVPEMLEKLLKNLNNFSLIDLGCGDGRFLYALHSKGLLKNAKRVVGVDISEERIERLKQNAPFAEGIIADVCKLKQIPNSSFDIVISSQVIEHVSDDKKMLREVYRILKFGGYLYISTIIKKWYGFWIYWNEGFKLDPTHIREYKSAKEFFNLLKENNFEVLEFKINKVSYPIIDLVIRVLINFGIVRPNPNFYLTHNFFKKIRKIKIPVIGYKSIEVIGRVRK
ncbi:MAG: class I SAM-dependent methyltransferase [Candidatus Aenigmatarchaeota archaeon]